MFEREGTALASDAAEDLEERKVATAPEGRSAPPFGAVAAARSEPAPAAAERAGLKVRLAAAARRYGDGAALVAVVILYCFWPSDFAPDRKWYGGADDVVFLTLLAFLARQVAKRTPALLNLPSAVSRAVRRRFRFNG
jgi:uncharacterized membrane protein YkvA (DUF1232 family)